MKILVINGPNINMLGIREPDIYGKQTFQNLLSMLAETADQLKIEIEQYQSNHWRSGRKLYWDPGISL